MTTPVGERPAAPAEAVIHADRWTRVLVFHIGSLGDTVLSVPALTALRAHLGPQATITMLHNDGPDARVAPTALFPDGLVDEVMRFPPPTPTTDLMSDAGTSRGRALLQAARRATASSRRGAASVGLALRLRRGHHDAVVNLALADRSDRALRRDRAFYRLCGIRHFVGFDPEAPGGPEAEVRLARLRSAGIAADLGDGPWIIPSAAAHDDAARWRSSVSLAADAPIVTLAPATLMDAKRWPIDRWAELARRLLAERGLEPVVVGGPADASEGDRLLAGCGGGANAAGALEPLGSAALMAGARLHIGVDTGTTHLAAAVGTPVVALFTHRAPIVQWAPMGSGHRIVDHPVPCAGCLAVVCPVAGHPCMTNISVDEVWAEIDATLSRLAAADPAR